MSALGDARRRHARPTREGYRVVSRPRRTPRGACLPGRAIGKPREWPAPVALQQFAKGTEVKIQVLGCESEMVAKLAHALF